MMPNIDLRNEPTLEQWCNQQGVPADAALKHWRIAQLQLNKAEDNDLELSNDVKRDLSNVIIGFSRIVCSCCNIRGHTASYCPINAMMYATYRTDPDNDIYKAWKLHKQLMGFNSRTASKKSRAEQRELADRRALFAQHGMIAQAPDRNPQNPGGR